MVFPLTIEQDTIYVHYSKPEEANGDPRYARAISVNLLGRPSLYKWDIAGSEWDRIDRR